MGLLDELIKAGKIRAPRPLKPGEVSLGGLFAPTHLSVGYARAARALFAAVAAEGRERDDLTEVAAPIFFLARHAVELALKDIAGVCWELERDLWRIDKGAFEQEPPTEAEVDSRLLEHGHVLGRLRA